MTGVSPTASARLYERARVALETAGRDAEGNDELHTLRVLAGDDPAVTTIVVVMAGSDTLCCYAVWPALVPEPVRAETALLVARGNATIFTSALELDLDSGGLSARAAVPTGRLDDDPVLLGGLLDDAVVEVNRVLDVHRPAVEAVLAGAPAAEAIGLRLQD